MSASSSKSSRQTMSTPANGSWAVDLKEDPGMIARITLSDPVYGTSELSDSRWRDASGVSLSTCVLVRLNERFEHAMTRHRLDRSEETAFNDVITHPRQHPRYLLSCSEGPGRQ